MFKKGFTLAEVLVTVGVIGVVAALTIPSLSNSYQKRMLATQLQKAYSQISQAGVMASADSMSNDFTKSNIIKDLKFIGPYLKAKKFDYDEIFADEYTSVDEDDKYGPSDYIIDDHECGKLSSGAVVCIDTHGHGILDVNGKKEPNVMGKDTFTIGFTATGELEDTYNRYLSNIINHDWDVDKYDEDDMK